MPIDAIGGEASSLLLDYMKQLIRENGDRNRRFRLVHAQVVAEKNFEPMGRLGVIAEVRPYHLSDDMPLKLAELVVLPESLLEMEPEQIRDVQVHYTMVGGKIVYERQSK